MRYQLTGQSQNVPTKPSVTHATEGGATDPLSPSMVVPAAIDPAAVSPPAIDLAKLTAAQLPTQVTLKVTTEVGDASGLKMKIDPGSRLTLVRIDGDEVVVSPGTSPFEGRVSVSGTDLMEQLEAKQPVAAAAPPAEEASPVEDPATAAVPTDPASAAATEPAVPDVSAAEPGTAAEPISAAQAAAPIDVVEVMKEHLRANAINEFKFEQVQEWKVGRNEVVAGVTYQTGLVRYSTDTIFGVKTIEAKALVRAGKVARWVWPKNPTLEIK
ncbi:MAG: hypothetical protein DVB25_08145 [Verrucomicrobia bacterium]|nr:MAG: hypothetical protein DVB25_08145 [Verrucomicrobiota bacterium]